MMRAIKSTEIWYRGGIAITVFNDTREVLFSPRGLHALACINFGDELTTVPECVRTKIGCHGNVP